MSVKVGGLLFPSKKAAAKFYKEILFRYPKGACIPPGCDFDFLRASVDDHSCAALKRGTGVAQFLVGSNAYGSRTFYIQRTDGTQTDFSYMKCIDKNLSAPRTRLIRALRAEIWPNVEELKSQYFDMHGDERRQISCPITGEKVGFADAHADHIPPRTFTVLVECFLTAHGIVPSHELIAPVVDMGTPRLADRELAARWVAYHSTMARFRIISSRANVARSAESKVPKGSLSLAREE